MKRLRVLAFIEARVLTGPAKNLINFGVQARGFSECPVDLVIATFERNDPRTNQFIAAAKQAGLQVEVILERGALDPGVLSSIRRLIERIQPDLVQTHAVKSHFLLWLTGTWLTIPWLAFHHGYTATDLKTRLYNQLDRVSLRWPGKVITVCRPFADELRRQGVPESRVTIVHNSIRPFEKPEDALVREFAAAFRLPEDSPALVTIGRLSREKGHADLVEAAALMRSNRPELSFRLLIVGEGPERPNLEERITSLGLQDVVTLCGHHANVRPFYEIASVVVLPSHSEGSPNVLLEAMAAGKPAVATAVGGVPEIAQHEVTALLVPKARPAQLADAISRLLMDRPFAAKVAAAAQQHAVEHFTPEIQLRSITGVYQQLQSN